jgi:tetratricopeptide (TPR) repeat protein
MSTYSRNRVWEDRVSLWEDVVSKSPLKARTHYNLGNAYKDKGDLINAEKAWKMTLEVKPSYARALNQLGNVYYFSNRLPEAMKYYSAALESDSTHGMARYNFALTLEKMDDTEGALRHYKLFIEKASSEYNYLIPKVRRKISLLSFQH